MPLIFFNSNDFKNLSEVKFLTLNIFGSDSDDINYYNLYY